MGERKRNTGKVFVPFVVNQKGEIHDPKILKSVEKSRNFDLEVLP
jgi:outer membrane biosynthesis protein TonB